MQDTALSPVKEFRTTTGTADLLRKIDIPVWNVVTILPLLFANNTAKNPTVPPIPVDDFFSAVNVTPIWPSWVADDAVTPECTVDHFLDVPYMFYTFRCPAAVNLTTDDEALTLPDLAITADFTSILSDINTMQASSPIILSPLTNLPMIFGLTDDLNDVFLRTVPTPLVPGVNLLASVITDIRQFLVHPALASLGIFQGTRAIWMAKIANVYPDPSPDIPRGANIATIRVWWQDDYSETPIIQDYRENSVLSGFASVGGLWTSLSGIFAIVFGASMLGILYGSKPLSIFGMAHGFQAKQMKEDCLRLYPDIIKEHRDKTHRGLLSLLRDHLIDLSFLKEESDTLEEEKLHVQGSKVDIENPKAGVEVNAAVYEVRNLEADAPSVHSFGNLVKSEVDVEAEKRFTPVRRPPL